MWGALTMVVPVALVIVWAWFDPLAPTARQLFAHWRLLAVAFLVGFSGALVWLGLIMFPETRSK